MGGTVPSCLRLQAVISVRAYEVLESGQTVFLGFLLVINVEELQVSGVFVVPWRRLRGCQTCCQPLHERCRGNYRVRWSGTIVIDVELVKDGLVHRRRCCVLAQGASTETSSTAELPLRYQSVVLCAR